jgi:dTDP-glucose pyrophosphorylase
MSVRIRFYAEETFPPFEIKASTTVREVMTAIDRLGLRCIALVGDSGDFLGLVTDGDLRRLIIAGQSINISSSVLLEKESFTVSESTGLEEVERIMDSRSVDQLPVVDEAKRYRGMFLFDSPELGRVNFGATGVIIAGGKGSRLRPLTINTPKPLIRVGDSSLLENALRAMTKTGVSKIFISVNYLAEKVMAEVKDGGDRGVDIEYLTEDFETGTAGSLSKLATMEVEESIIVSNADILHRSDLRDFLVFHQQNEADLSILTMPFQVSVPFGVIETRESEFERILEKPTYTFSVSAGVYVLSRELIGAIPKDRKYDMPELIDDAKKNARKILAYEGSGPWIDVGTPGNLEKARETWADE